MSEYISYKKIAESIGIKKGDRVYLSSDILMLSFIAMKNGEKFDLDELLNGFIEAIGEEGTLLIPTFNFDFSNKGHYDYKNTMSTTGALGNAALKREDFKRTKHPMHSFCVWGHDKELLCELNNLNSFGPDSPFGYMKENNVIQVMLGADYQRSMTFVHFVETNAKVPYRFHKTFTGTYVYEDGHEETVTYEYPARVLEYGTHEMFNRIGAILEEKGISRKYDINGVAVNVCPLGDSYDTIYEDASNNMCRNLYDFDTDRDVIWRS